LTSEGRVPVEVTWMQLVSVSPGLALLMVSMAVPESLSVRATVPAVPVLPLLGVVKLNALKVEADGSRAASTDTKAIPSITRDPRRRSGLRSCLPL
jgi:hypothetical protein